MDQASKNKRMIIFFQKFTFKSFLIVFITIGSAFFVSCNSEKIIERAIRKDPSILLGDKEFITSILPVEIETEERKTLITGRYNPGSISFVKDEKTGISVAIKIDQKSGKIEAEVIEPKKTHSSKVEVKKVIIRPEVNKKESFKDKIARHFANFGFLVLCVSIVFIFIIFYRIKF